MTGSQAAMRGDSQAVTSLRAVLRLYSRSLSDKQVIEVSQYILTLLSHQGGKTKH